MKKIITLILAALMVVTCFAGCAKENPTENNSSKTKAATVKLIDVQLTDEQYAFAVNPNDADLLKAADELLTEIKANGTFDTIIAKYFKNEGTPTGFEAGTVDKSKNQLVVATNTPFSPFEYKEGNKFYGVDMEIADLLAKKLGKELVIVDMEFDAIVTSVNTGTADMGMAGLTISEDRKTLVNFTAPYYNASQKIIVKGDDTTFDGLTTVEAVEEKIKTLSNVSVGFQTGTTGELYVSGDADWGFDGFANVKAVGFESAASAVTDMLNGNIAFVVVDEAPALSIVTAVNG